MENEAERMEYHFRQLTERFLEEARRERGLPPQGRPERLGKRGK